MHDIEYSYELYHFGIKGMKWGIRRFQKKDGSLTPAGRKRYDDEPSNGSSTTSAAGSKSTRSSKSSGVKTKTTHRQRLEQKYRDQGMSEEQARAAADKRIKTEKVIAATAALTLVAATAYVANKHIRERADGYIKSGTTLQRIAKDPTVNMDNAMYTAYNKSDMTKYKGMYGTQLMGQSGRVHKISLNADKDIKIVSRDKAASVFADLYKNDPDFKKSFDKVNDTMRTHASRTYKTAKIHGIAAGKMTDKQLKRAGYDAFNRGLALHDEDGNAISKKFYDRLKSMGYDAVMDINDQKYSGYKSKKPVILFNAKNSVSVSKAEEMSPEQIISNAKKAYVRLLAPQMAAAGSAYVGAKYGKKKLEEMSLVREYKRQHPDTKMTDKEIAELMYQT